MIGDADYFPVSDRALTFQPSFASQQVCGDIRLVNDSILEINEQFLVVLSSSDNAAVIDSNTATVTINNDDRKLFSEHLNSVLLFDVYTAYMQVLELVSQIQHTMSRRPVLL